MIAGGVPRWISFFIHGVQKAKGGKFFHVLLLCWSITHIRVILAPPRSPLPGGPACANRPDTR